MKLLKYITPFVLGFLIMIGSVSGQGQQMQRSQPDSITKEELKKFAEISNEAKKIQKETREKVDSMLSEVEMDMKRFQQIMMSKRNPKKADTLNITKEEQQTIKELQPKLMKMQQESQRKFVAIIQDNGLKPQRFQQIMQAVRTDPQVMKRFQRLVRDPSAQN